MIYSNTWILWFTRQLDLELMFSSVIPLRTTNWNKWTKLFTDLLALFIHWFYLFDLVALFNGFIYWPFLFIAFIYSIWWIYLLDLSIGFSFSVYNIHSHSNFSQIFSQLRREHLYISLTIHVSRAHVKNLPLSIKLILLQLHHHTSLIKLTNITSLHHNYNKCSILTLNYSNIVSHYSVSIHLQFPSDTQLLHLPSIFISISQRCASYSISK